MGLEDRMKNPVGLLSGGQRQALTLLMATMVPPDLLLLDEHTAALDPATADKVLKLTQEIIEKNNTTCLMVTPVSYTHLDVYKRQRQNIIFIWNISLLLKVSCGT